MQSLNELIKLTNVFWFLIATTFKAVFQQDLDSRKTLTKLYLKSQYHRSYLPKVSIEVDGSDVFTISSLHYADLELKFEDRFLLLESTDLLALLALLKQSKPKRIFEFGVMRGGSLLHFILNSQSGVQIDSLDINEGNITPLVRKIISENPKVKIHIGNSLQFDPEPFRQQIDFIFIDGGHDYDIVKNDTLKAKVMLRPGGVIVWDDYSPACKGVFNYVNEFFNEHGNVCHIKDSKIAFWKDKLPL